MNCEQWGEEEDEADENTKEPLLVCARSLAVEVATVDVAESWS